MIFKKLSKLAVSVKQCLLIEGAILDEYRGTGRGHFEAHNALIPLWI